MANQTAARVSGDDYQHLFAWMHVLELLMPNHQVSKIIVEDESAGSADDVTLLRQAGSNLPDRYHQIKYHVDHRNGYCEDSLTERKKKEHSLLQKWYRSWESLAASRPDRSIEIHIVSNWGWKHGSVLAALVDGPSNKLKEELYTAAPGDKAGRLRIRLATHINATIERLFAFVRTLRFHFGYSCWKEMAERAAERMENQGLKHDDSALLVAVGIIREWVKAGRREITREVLDGVITRHSLRQPGGARLAVNVYLSTIKAQKFDVTPDYVLDWRPYFSEGVSARGHETLEQADWNEKMLPELRALESRISTETSQRFIRVRGLARLSAWIAFGHSFSEVARYTLEIDQQGQLWQSDAKPNADFMLTSNGAGEDIGREGDSVAVGISVSGNLEEDVRRSLHDRGERIKAVLFIRPDRSLDRHCLRNAGDAVSLADGVKRIVREFVKVHKAKRLLLYYLGPLGAACFIGHRLNAVCREIQLMEWVDPTYVPAFTLA